MGGRASPTTTEILQVWKHIEIDKILQQSETGTS